VAVIHSNFGGGDAHKQIVSQNSFHVK
jgi:hypothetical protein